MNRHRFKSDMEAAWELRPMTDATPMTCAHINRHIVKNQEKKSVGEIKADNNTKT